MRYAKALAIFDDLDNPQISDNEKGKAIYIVMNLATHNGITKAQLLRAIKYLFWLCFEPDEIDEKKGSDEA